jgi:hypothetical protein
MSLFIICYKPLYTLCFLLVFFFEYLFFIKYVYTIYINYDGYLILEVGSIDIGYSNTLEIWIMYCRLLAFSRLYVVLSKKTIDRRVIFSIIWYFLGVPIRFIKIIYFLIFKNKRSFKEGIRVLYLNLYYILKDLKIEVLSRKIYLNSGSLGKLLRSTSLHKEEKSKAFKLLTDLKSISLDIVRHESRMDSMDFRRGTMITQEGSIIHSHYTYFDGNALHATSNLPRVLMPSQMGTHPIKSLIAEGARNPASIITLDPKKIIYDTKIKSVSSGEVYSAIYEHLNKFEIPEENYKYVAEKVYRYEYVLQIYTKNVNTELSKDLRCNLYTHALINASSQDMLDVIEEWSNDFT